MSFDAVPAEAYARFMGRYADPLAPLFANTAGLTPGQRVLDVGCGPGALTAVLVELLGPDAVAALDPSPSFVAAASARFPTVDVRQGMAEDLPFEDDAFDGALAQLVVHFMTDPEQGMREMARVTVPGGAVAACVWDHGGGRGPLSPFWSSVADLHPGSSGESGLSGAREGQLRALASASGWGDPVDGELTVRVSYPSFDDWWEPYTMGVGPAGAYVTGLSGADREALRQRCAERLPAASFEIEATAWTVRGIA